MSSRKRSIENNLEEMVTQGQASAYEALQLYRSRCNRLKQKKEFMQAISIAAKGTYALISNGYENAAGELSAILTNLLDESGLDISPEIRKIVTEVDNAFAAFVPTVAACSTAVVAAPTKPATSTISKAVVETTSRIEYLKALVVYSMKNGQREYGDPMFHSSLGSCLWDYKAKGPNPAPPSPLNVGAFGLYHRKSTYHFAVGEAPMALWNKIHEDYSPLTAATGTPEDEVNLNRERERLVVIGILQFLGLENLRDANILYKQYVNYIQNKKPSAGGKKAAKKTGSGDAGTVVSVEAVGFVDSELMKFCDMLLQTATRDAGPLYKALCNAYGPHLNFDPVLPALLMGPIGIKLFNVTAQNRQMGPPGGMPGMPGLNPNMMAMMQQMMAGGGQM